MSVTKLVNGVSVDVKFNDGSVGLVMVKELSIRQLYQFVEMSAKDQTPELVALCIGQAIEFVDRLSIDSFGVLAEEAIKANFPLAMRLAEKDPSIAAKLYPIISKLAALVKSVTGLRQVVGEAGKLLSQEPAPSASVPATGSASSTTPPAG